MSLTLFVFRSQTIIPLVMSLVLYAMLEMNPLITIIAAFLSSSAVHIYCMLKISLGWQWMVNSLTMIMLQKVWMTTIDLYHGRKIKKGEKVRPFFESAALYKKPSLLEWLTYIFTPFGAFSGPATCYKVHDFMFDVGEKPRISDDSKSHKEARKRFLMIPFWLILAFLSIKIAKIEFYSMPFYVNSNHFMKVVLMIICAMFHAAKYFAAWQSVEAGIYETGAGESGITEFDDISNLTIFDVLMSDSNGIWLQRWNHSAHIFWKRYLLYPLLDHGVKYSIANPLIFVFSALWHGFYPVYYMLLPEMIAAVSADQLINHMFPNLLKTTPIFINVIYRFWIWWSMLVTTSTWWYRSAEAFIFVRKSQDFFGSIVIFLVFIIAKITSLFIKPKRHQRKTENPNREEEKPKELNKETNKESSEKANEEFSEKPKAD